jgi:hypothetical protein
MKYQLNHVAIPIINRITRKDRMPTQSENNSPHRPITVLLAA